MELKLVGETWMTTILLKVILYSISEASSALFKLIQEAWRCLSLISTTIGDSLLYVLYKYIFYK